MNAAHTTKHLEDVGNKTNLTIFTPDVPMDIEDGANPYLFWCVSTVPAHHAFQTAVQPILVYMLVSNERYLNDKRRTFEGGKLEATAQQKYGMQVWFSAFDVCHHKP